MTITSSLSSDNSPSSSQPVCVQLLHFASRLRKYILLVSLAFRLSVPVPSVISPLCVNYDPPFPFQRFPVLDEAYLFFNTRYFSSSLFSALHLTCQQHPSFYTFIQTGNIFLLSFIYLSLQLELCPLLSFCVASLLYLL